MGNYFQRANNCQRRLKFAYVLCLIAVMVLFQMNAHSQENLPLDVACDLLYAKLNQDQLGQLEMHYQRFAEEGNMFDGCVITMSAPKTDLFDGSHPRSLFENEQKDIMLDAVPNETKWRLDKEADGPDGTSFRATKGQLFCLVSAAWDGGDDGDPSYVPQKYLEMLIQCAYK